MSQKVLIIPDKFKGTLTAHEAASAIERGWRTVRPDDEITCQPMSDGGDGFGKILSELLRCEERLVQTVDAAHRPHKAKWWFNSKNKTAIIESANIIGLALLPRGHFHPFELDTRGLATALHEAEISGAERCVIGIGGSATNDGGFGLARGLGWRFLDRDSNEIEAWTELHRLEKIVPPENLLSTKIQVAVDVQNTLLGLQGASRIYGPQKGLKESDFEKAEECLGRLAEKCNSQFGRSISELPGTGAAGGLGFGLAAFLNGSLESGFDLFAEHARVAHKVSNADLVITGEGSMDESTLMGKGVGELIQLCLSKKKRCIGLSGVLENKDKLEQKLEIARSLTPDFCSKEEAMSQPAKQLELLAQATAREWPGPVQ